MATLTVSEIVERVAASVTALEGWRRSKWTFEQFPFVEPGQFAHRVVAVGAPRTEWDSPVESSPTRRGADGGLVGTVIGVRWTWQIRADNQPKDYGAGLDAEALLIRALVAVDPENMHLSLVDQRRVVVGNGTWLLGEISASVTHRYALE